MCQERQEKRGGKGQEVKCAGCQSIRCPIGAPVWPQIQREAVEEGKSYVGKRSMEIQFQLK